MTDPTYVIHQTRGKEVSMNEALSRIRRTEAEVRRKCERRVANRLAWARRGRRPGSADGRADRTVSMIRLTTDIY